MSRKQQQAADDGVILEYPREPGDGTWDLISVGAEEFGLLLVS